jgi:hypothetical protein
MRVDTYTKAVLTVIAACLVWLCFGGFATRTVSADGPQDVRIVGWKDAADKIHNLPVVRRSSDAYSLPVCGDNDGCR